MNKFIARSAVGRSIAVAIAAICTHLVLFTPSALAEEPETGNFKFDTEEYLLSVRRHELNDFSRVIGWQVAGNIYFGRQQGDEDAFGFLWQRPGSQISLTNKGLGWHKRLSH